MHTVPMLLLINDKYRWENDGKCAVWHGKECTGV